MNTPKIEKGIPIPKKFDCLRLYTWVREMNEGDSVLIKYDEKGKYKKLAAAICYAAKKDGVRLTARKVNEGYRLWRVAEADASKRFVPFPDSKVHCWNGDGGESTTEKGRLAQNG